MTKLSLKNRALIALICVCAVLFGVIAASTLKKELFPSFELPQAVVVTQYQGAGPEAVEREVTDPLETALTGLQSVEHVDSQSSTGSSQITVETKYGTDSDDVVRELQRAVSQVQSQLPDGVEPNVISGGMGDLPVLVISANPAAAEGDATAADTERLAGDLRDVVVPELKKVDGVRSATVSGGRTKQVDIVIDKDDLKDEGVSVDQLAAVLQANGVPTSAGDLADGKQNAPVEVGKRITSVKQIRNLVVTGSDGPVKVSKVADVALKDAPVTSVSRTNGQPSLTLSVTKKPDANTVDVARAVGDALPGLGAKIGNPDFTTLFDQSPFIDESIKDLMTEGVLGLVFAVLVILVFLFSVRATVITAISIPMSLLITLIALWQGGQTLNMLTLAALTISIGRVVDDSIVVIEAIRRRQAAGSTGTTKFSNILAAVGEVAGAITASTLTTVAVFAPLIFVSGQTGELFRPFALTVTIALLSSLLVALTIVPVLAYWFLRAREARIRLSGDQKREIRAEQRTAVAMLRRHRRDGHRGRHTVGDGEAESAAAGEPSTPGEDTVPLRAAGGSTGGGAAAKGLLGGAAAGTLAAEAPAPAVVDELAGLRAPATRLQRTYLPVIGWTTKHPVITLVAAVIVLVLTFAMVPRLKTELLGDTGEGSLQVQQTFPAGLSIEQAADRAKPVEQLLARDPGIESFQFSVGDDQFGFGSSGGSLLGSYLINVREDADPAEVGDRIRQATAKLEDAGEVALLDGQSTVGGSTIDVNLTANSTEDLRKAAAALTKALDGTDGVSQVENDQAATKEVVRVDVDHRKAAKKGLSEAAIGQAVARAMDGQTIGNVVFDNVTHKVLLFDGRVTDVDELKNLKITVAGGASAGDAGAFGGAAPQAGGQVARAGGTVSPDPTASQTPTQTPTVTATASPTEEPTTSAPGDEPTATKTSDPAQQPTDRPTVPGQPTQPTAPGPGQEIPGGGQMPNVQVPGGYPQIPGGQYPAGQMPTGQVPGQMPGGYPSSASAQPKAKTVKLKDVAKVRTVSTPPVISHSDGLRSAKVSVTPSGDDLGAASAAVQKVVDQTHLPSGVSADMGGATQEQTDAFSQLGLAMLAAILIVFVILVATFKSLAQPFILLVSIPFAATGSIGLLLATGTPLGLTGMIGMLMLIGIVVTNAIVLIDLINHFRAHGVGLREAVVQGARLRYRPIIMTALATIFALTPMALGLTGGGVFISRPLAIVVIGGLVSSTLLTLVLVPVLYLLLEGTKERRRDRREARETARARVLDQVEAGGPAPVGPAGPDGGGAAGDLGTDRPEQGE
nr:efflux RND transporter permease subunit [Brevibacterium sp. 68QC2CO]